MTRSLDDLLQKLARFDADRSLAQLEPAVWRRVRTQAAPAGVFGPLRVATVSLALLVGVAVGGAAATAATGTSREMGVFALHPELAPSTLLEGAR